MKPRFTKTCKSHYSKVH